MSLQAPPKQDTPSRLVGRLLVLVLMAAAAAFVIYTAVTNQRIDLVEDIRTAGLDLDDPVEVNGVTINVTDDGGSGTPVVLLHDVDVTGGLTLGPLAESLVDDHRVVRVDMPGFGYSDRVPFETYAHTAAGMADIMSLVLEERFSSPVIVVGAGFGGEVAAELAYSYPDLVSGTVLVDADFWSSDRGFVHSLQTLPWIGKAATYTWETGGRFALDNWSPYCADGGWCPSVEQLSLRAFIVEIEDTTVSLHEFIRTRGAALAPANLDEITVPMAYVWSTDGDVPQDTVDRISDEASGVTVIESDSYQAHLEDFDSVVSAVDSLG